MYEGQRQSSESHLRQVYMANVFFWVFFLFFRHNGLQINFVVTLKLPQL